LIYSHAERFVAFLQTAAREKLEQVDVLSATHTVIRFRILFTRMPFGVFLV